MDCTTYPPANALNYCASKDYGPGILNVGELFPYVSDTPMVLFTNLATDRKQVVGVDADLLPAVVIEQPDDLAPGTVYRVQVVGLNDVEGINPLTFYPYLFDQASGNYAPDTDNSTEGVTVQFVKLFAGDDVHSHTDQWMTLQ